MLNFISMKKTATSSSEKVNYVTENYLDRRLFVLKQELKEEIVGEIDEKNKKYKDEVMTKLDDISGQLEDLQEDKVLSIHQTSQLREEVEDHEKRIKNLEKIQQTV